MQQKLFYVPPDLKT